MSDEYKWIHAHGATMAGAWCLFLPLAMLMARHRWLFAGRGLFGLPVWHHVHRGLALSGVGLFVASFTIAMTKLDIPDGQSGWAHRCIGIAVMSGTGVVVAMPLLRPVEGRAAVAWGWVHGILGRVTWMLAVANVYIGIYCMHFGIDEPYARWLAPISATVFALFVADVLLTIVSFLRSRAATQPPVAA